MQLNVGIIGASGYLGEELVGLVLGHPHAELKCVTSRQHAGKSIAEVFPKFSSKPKATQVRFRDSSVPDVVSQFKESGPNSVVFLALPHGVAAEWASALHGAKIATIDLSADFRLDDPAVYQEFYNHPHPAPALLKEFVYGLAEINGAAIAKSRFVASPGCYPTSILIPLIPLLRAKLIEKSPLSASSMSGVSGAGRKAEEAFLFCECNESLRSYGVPKHRHLSEIEQELSKAAGSTVTIQFIPHLVPVNRGIHTTIFAKPTVPADRDLESKILDCWKEAYSNSPFVRILDAGGRLPDTKSVTFTNTIEIACKADARTGQVILLSAEDNVVKGGSGQALQAMNIMFGLNQTDGLSL
jgi:N-acetyl-gamma-glutamyl-phosphate reductase